MSVNIPPDPNVSTFNNLYWISRNNSLTTADGDLRYLKFPIAQGTENLQATNIQGVLTCNSTSTFNGAVDMNNNNINDVNQLNFYNAGVPTTQITAYTGGVAGTYTNTDMTIDANGKISVIANGTSPTTLLGLNNSWTGTNDFLNTGTGSLTSSATQPVAGDSSTKIPTTAWTQGAIDAKIPASLLGLNNTWTGTNAFNNAAPITSSATQPAANDSSTKIPTTAWVQSAIAAIPPPVAVEYTYTQQYTGGLGSTTITIPNLVVKFDVKVIGTGGLAGFSFASPPSGGEPEYTLTATGTGGGAGVAYKEGIIIARNNAEYTNSMSYNNLGTGQPTTFTLNGEEVCRVFSGGDGNLGVAGAGCSTPAVVNNNWGSDWVSWNGQAGLTGPFITYNAPPDFGQVGGGNKYGGVIGNPVITGASQGAVNVAGSGQLWGALSGPSYGFPTYSASPINYGGVIITWYIRI
jgi:hypothetical protein